MRISDWSSDVCSSDLNLDQLNTAISGVSADTNPLAVSYDDNDKDSITLQGTSGTTKITQLAAGDLSATSTDAVNGSQLYATNQNVTQNTSDISGLDTRVTINESEIETNTNDIAVLDARVYDPASALAGMVADFGGGAAGGGGEFT